MKWHVLPGRHLFRRTARDRVGMMERAYPERAFRVSPHRWKGFWRVEELK